MEGKGKIESGQIENKEASIFNRDLLIFIFFLILSFIFWYLNSLSKEIDGNVRYPVRYINLPKDRVMIEEMPSKLNLSLKGPGYSILKLKLSGNQAPVVIDLSTVNYVIISNSKLLNYYVVTKGLIPTFKQQLRADFEITDIKPDTLFFKFDRVITKMVPVNPVVEVTTERQYFIKGPISSTPGSIEISGPRQIVDTVKSVSTKRYKFNQLNKSVTRSLALIGSDFYDISEKRVSVTIPVEQFTEATTNVPVRLLNLPDTLEIKIFPDVVSVKYLVGVTDYKTINKTPLDAFIDLSKFDLSEVNKLPVVIQNIPAYISSIRCTPEKVDFDC